MKKILFLSDINLENPNRGTPIRIYHFLKEISKEHDLRISVRKVPKDLENICIIYPTGTVWNRIWYFRQPIKKESIDLVFTATESNIRLPIILKALTGVKIVIDLHGIMPEELYFKNQIGYFKKELLLLLNKFYLSFYDLIFTVSIKLRDFYSLSEPIATHIYGGIDEKLIPPNSPNEPNFFTIGYMGNARPYQGLEDLLLAAKNLKDSGFSFKLNLVISGDVESVKSNVEEKGLSDLSIIADNISHMEAMRIIENSTVLVIPRPFLQMTEYAFPSKLPEFLATGVPVILTNVGPVSELIPDDAALIIENNQISVDVERAIRKLYELGPEKRKEIGIRGKKFVVNNLTWFELGEKVNKYLSNL